ncbi:AKH_1a_G0018110.mRNA.1.CDS.1 [Saccharomyces cerevisiae]|nr:AKH_1a_G0018110.mRNA.1.CDS.1 [Saccharomyces cerevisiae]CAI6655082.1 AKH_1a_G0018110.mRNA.1.CDS.1 [Saccharomyces cerevisiae]
MFFSSYYDKGNLKKNSCLAIISASSSQPKPLLTKAHSNIFLALKILNNEPNLPSFLLFYVSKKSKITAQITKLHIKGDLSSHRYSLRYRLNGGNFMCSIINIQQWYGPKRQTVSLQEKKNRILNFFQETYTFYNIKELEKSIPKKCGISPMIVKDLVQQMIDEDGIISVEKCGNINIYWCFKNQTLQKLYDSSELIKKKIQEVKCDIATYKQELDKTLATGRRKKFTVGQKSYNREALLEKRKKIQDEIKKKSNSLQKIESIRWDEAKIQENKQQIRLKKVHLEKTTDNIEILIDYLYKKFFLKPEQIRKEFGIPEEFKEFTEV